MIAMPRPWVWTSFVGAVLAVFALVASAHEAETPHQLVLTSFAVQGDSLRVVSWVERPTAVVARAFRERFADDRDAAADQDAAFRREQWGHMAEGLVVRVDGVLVDRPLRPLPMPNNGRGNDVRFVYGVGTTLDVSGRDRVVVEYDNQTHLDAPHVFLSVYADVDAGWRVVEDSSEAIAGEARGGGPVDGATWSHDRRLRQGRIVFERK